MKRRSQIIRILQSSFLGCVISFNAQNASAFLDPVTIGAISAVAGIIGTGLNSVEHESQKKLLKQQIRLVLDKISEVNNNIAELKQTTCQIYKQGSLADYEAFKISLNDYLDQPIRELWVNKIQDIAMYMTQVRVHWEPNYLVTNCGFNAWDVFPMYVALSNVELNVQAESMRDTYREYYLRDPQTGLIRSESQVSQATLDTMNQTIRTAIQRVFNDRFTAFRDYLVSIDAPVTTNGSSHWKVFSDSTFDAGPSWFCQPVPPPEYSDTPPDSYCVEHASYHVRAKLYSYGREYLQSSGPEGPLQITAPLGTTELDFQYLYDPLDGAWANVWNVYARHRYESYISFARNIYQPYVATINSWLALQDPVILTDRPFVNYPSLQVDRDLASYVDFRRIDYDGDQLSDIDEVLRYGTNRDAKDTDGDGIDDYYEVTHAGLNPNISDGWGDLDGDGYSNLLEYIAGSDATSVQSTPKTALAAKLVPIINLILN